MRVITDLPIESVLDEIRSKLSRSDSLIVTAEPGAGKSTVVPLALLDDPWLENRKIIMLEPRRIAARAVAKRMAFLLGERVGETVGFRTRTETAVSPKTRIEVVTEAILTRMIQSNPELPGVGLVIFDEFHERSIHADLGLALALDARSVFREDLKLLMMSATLDHLRLSELLNNAPVVAAAGRTYNVRVIHSNEMRGSPPEQRTGSAVINALKAFQGDILVFLPGEHEIRKTMVFLERKVDDDTLVLPLYGNLSASEQDKALEPDNGNRRKVILSTSIAESSITVDGVRIVIDSGLMRLPRFSPKTGMNTLETVPVSKASAEQRKGRAGRTSEGVCIRLWTEFEHASLPAYNTPEIMETDFAPVMLELLKWGLNDKTASSLRWLDFPPEAKVTQAFSLLKELGAVTENNRLSAHGEKLLGFPLHPRLAHMVLESVKYGLTQEAADLAALLSERDPFKMDSADIEERLHRLSGNSKNIYENISRLSAQIRSFVPASSRKENAELSILPALAYPDRLARQREPGGTEYILANGTTASLRKGDPLAFSEFLAVAQAGGQEANQRIFMASPITRQNILKYFPSLIEDKTVMEWDSEAKAVRISKVKAIGSLVLEQSKLSKNDVPEKELANVFLSGIRKHGIASMNFSDSENSFLARVHFLHRFFPEDYPDFSENALMDSLESWLGPFVSGFTRLEDLKKVNLRAALESMLTHAALMKMSSLAPEKLTVPSGSNIRINYENPEQPVVPVRLQEIFGLRETPKIAGGRIALLIDILSPAMRTVQKTSDLKSFWENSYFLVRKDMRGRYPKHDWPENPLGALPHRGVRKKKS